LARHAGSIAVGLHELDILARTGSSDFHEHVAIVIWQQSDSQSEKHNGVSLQDFSVQKTNSMILLGGHGKKRRFYRVSCRTRVISSNQLVFGCSCCKWPIPTKATIVG
jgi:hypothetical protein